MSSAGGNTTKVSFFDQQGTQKNDITERAATTFFPQETEHFERINTHRSSNSPSALLTEYEDQFFKEDHTKIENVFIEQQLKVLESNAKYFESQAHPLFVENSDLQDQLIIIHELIRERTKEFFTLAKDKGPNGEHRELSQQIGDLKGAFYMIREDLRGYTVIIDQYASDKKRLQEEVHDLKYQLDQASVLHRRQIEAIKQEFQEQIKTLEVEIDSQNKVISNLQIELKNERADKERIIDLKNQEIQELKYEIQYIKDQLRLQEIEYQSQILVLQQQINMLKEQFIQEKHEILQRHEEFIARQQDFYENQIIKLKDDYQAEIRMRDEQIQTLRQHNEKLSSELDALREKTTQEIRELKEKLNQLQIENGQQTQIIQQRDEEIAQLKKLVSELQQEQIVNLARIEALEQQLADLMAEYKAYQEKMQFDNSELKKRCRFLEFQLQRKEKEWSDQLENEKKKHEMQLKQTIKQLTDQYEEMLRLLRLEMENAIKNLERQREELINSLQDRISQLQDQNFRLQQRLEEIQRQWEGRYRDLDEKMKRKIQDLEISYQKQIDQLQRRRVQELQDLDQLRQTQLLNLEIQKANQISDLKQLNRVKMAELQAYHIKRYDEMQERLLKRIKQLEQQRLRELEELRKYYQDELQQLRDQLQFNNREILDEINAIHQQQMEDLKNYYEDQIKNLISQWESQFKRQMDEYEKKIQELNELIEKERKQVARLLEELKRLKQLHQETLKRLKLEHEQEMRKLRQGYEQQIRRLIQEKEALERRIDDLLAKIRDLLEEINRLKAQNARYQSKFEELNRQFQEEVQQIADQYKIQQVQFQEQCEDEINKLLKQHLQFVERMKSQFGILIAAHRDRIEQLLNEYRELQKLFNDRPSRADDIRHIQMLMKEIDMLKKQLAEMEIKILEANQIVQYLQLELENYKKVYDIFGPNNQNNPNLPAIQKVSLPESPLYQSLMNTQPMMPSITHEQNEQMTPILRNNVAIGSGYNPSATKGQFGTNLPSNTWNPNPNNSGTVSGPEQSGFPKDGPNSASNQMPPINVTNINGTIFNLKTPVKTTENSPTNNSNNKGAQSKQNNSPNSHEFFNTATGKSVLSTHNGFQNSKTPNPNETNGGNTSTTAYTNPTGLNNTMTLFSQNDNIILNITPHGTLKDNQEKTSQNSNHNNQLHDSISNTVDTRYIKYSQKQSIISGKEDDSNFSNPLENAHIMKNAEQFVDQMSDDKGKLHENSSFVRKRRGSIDRQTATINFGSMDTPSPIKVARYRRPSSQNIQYENSDQSINDPESISLNKQKSFRLTSVNPSQPTPSHHRHAHTQANDNSPMNDGGQRSHYQCKQPQFNQDKVLTNFLYL